MQFSRTFTGASLESVGCLARFVFCERSADKNSERNSSGSMASAPPPPKMNTKSFLLERRDSN